MAKTLQFRRGSTALINTYAGSDGELFVDTSKSTVVVMDGGTLGGTPLATERFVTSALNRIATTSVLGTVKVDSTSITISSGTISVPVATSSQIGILRADGTSLTVNNGVLQFNPVQPNSYAVSGTVVMSSPYSYRNKLANGNFLFWQRGTSTSTTNTYLADRWITQGISDVRQSTDVPDTNLFQYSIEYGYNSFSYPFISQRIPAVETLGLISSTVTLSFWAKNISGTSNLYVELWYPTNTDQFTSTTVNVGGATLGYYGAGPTSSWGFYTYTWASSAMVTGFSKGLEIRIIRSNESTSITRVTGVQLEAGDRATPFERLPVFDQLSWCQRYFELVGGTTGTWQGTYYHQRYKVAKRASPVLSLFNGSLSGANFDGGADPTNSFRLPYTATASSASDYTIASNAEI